MTKWFFSLAILYNIRLSFMIATSAPFFKTSSIKPVENVKTAKPSKINVMVKSRPAGEMGATSVNPTVVKVIPA